MTSRWTCWGDASPVVSGVLDVVRVRGWAVGKVCSASVSWLVSLHMMCASASRSELRHRMRYVPNWQVSAWSRPAFVVHLHVRVGVDLAHRAGVCWRGLSSPDSVATFHSPSVIGLTSSTGACSQLPAPRPRAAWKMLMPRASSTAVVSIWCCWRTCLVSSSG